jgi:hypothetical protein
MVFEHLIKRKYIVLDRVNDQERLELRRQLAAEFLTNSSMDDSKNIFIDESRFNLHMSRNYGWSIRGIRDNVPVYTTRERNITLSSAISGCGCDSLQIIFWWVQN